MALKYEAANETLDKTTKYKTTLSGSNLASYAIAIDKAKAVANVLLRVPSNGLAGSLVSD